mgnify:CR=1 FL=1
MKFFIDTANLEQIREAYDLGVLDGVTTNPSLMAKEGIKVNYALIIAGGSGTYGRMPSAIHLRE